MLNLAFFLLLHLVPAWGQDDPAPEPAEGEAPLTMDEADAVEAESEPPPPLPDLSNPRAAVQAFVVAMQQAESRPEAIDEAILSLESDWLEDQEDAGGRVRALATELSAALSTLGVSFDAVPNETRSRKVTTHSVMSPDGSKSLTITLVRGKPLEGADADVSHAWRFSEETLKALPALRAALATVADLDADYEGRTHLRSPRATMEAFLEAMRQDPPDLDRAATCLMPGNEQGASAPVIAHDNAYRLYTVLLRARPPVLSTVPDRVSDPRYTWWVHSIGRIGLERVPKDDEKTEVYKGEWRFSRSTLASVEKLYDIAIQHPRLEESVQLGYEDKTSVGLAIERTLPGPLRTKLMGVAVWSWFGALLLFGAAALLFAVANRVALWAWGLFHEHGPLELDPGHGVRLARALATVTTVALLHRATQTNLLLLPPAPLDLLYPTMTALTSIAFVLVALRVTEMAEEHYLRGKAAQTARAATLIIPLIETFCRLIIGAIIVVFVLGLFGFSRNAVLGGLGLLGAAVGFGARESIANAVGAISIVFDRPFRVGDWVNYDGTDATVERLGMLSVRLRTFYNSVVVVPNARIVSTAVDNYGERKYRRMKHYLRLRYDTPAHRIDALCEGLRELVRLHPYTRKDYYHIYLNELTPSSANVMMYLFFEVPDWATELRERHRFLIDALALVEELGIELAFPTQRVILESAPEDGEPLEDLPGPAELAGRREARRHFDKAYGRPPEARGPVQIPGSPLTAGHDDDDGDGD